MRWGGCFFPASAPACDRGAGTFDPFLLRANCWHSPNPPTAKGGFLAEVGDLSGYDHSQQIVRHAGLSLRENSSGLHKGETTISKRGRCRLRALLYRAALTMVAKNPQFRALHLYFTTRRDNPLKKKQSMIALCIKLIRVLFELGRKQKNYDASKVLGPHREAQLQAAA